MRYEFEHEDGRVGTAQWEGPGQVRLDVADATDREFMRSFFASEVTYLAAGFDEVEAEDEAFQHRRRDWTPWEFERACRALGRRRGWRARRTASEPVENRREAS